jgi:uncharacterized protein (DUF488 family)
MELFTIGHSTHSTLDFVKLLQEHNITALADVRSHPYSRYLPHFNQMSLKDVLSGVNIHYEFLGKELGARPSNKNCHVDGKAVYEKIAATDLFSQGIKRIIKGIRKHGIALMCAEKDPIVCHRAILVCQHLRCENNLEINYIKSNGDLEPHCKLEERLLAKHGLKELALVAAPIQLSLFANNSANIQTSNLPSKEEYIKNAYKLQGDEIAYIERQRNKDE